MVMRFKKLLKLVGYTLGDSFDNTMSKIVSKLIFKRIYLTCDMQFLFLFQNIHFCTNFIFYFFKFNLNIFFWFQICISVPLAFHILHKEILRIILRQLLHNRIHLRVALLNNLLRILLTLKLRIFLLNKDLVHHLHHVLHVLLLLPYSTLKVKQNFMIDLDLKVLLLVAAMTVFKRSIFLDGLNSLCSRGWFSNSLS